MSIKKKADLKVIILGEYDVGKTSLLRRYIEGQFRDYEEPTVGAAFYLKQWGPYNVAVWDTAGDEKYSGLSHFYCRSAGAAILAFDLKNVSTFESLWARFSNILEAANENCIKIVVGTKLDSVDSETRQVTSQEGQKLAQELNAGNDVSKMSQVPYFETSSLEDRNVTELFQFILNTCLPLSSEQVKRQKHQNNKSTVDLMENSGKTGRQKKCAC